VSFPSLVWLPCLPSYFSNLIGGVATSLDLWVVFWFVPNPELFFHLVPALLIQCLSDLFPFMINFKFIYDAVFLLVD